MNTANPKLRQLLQLKLRERRFLTTEEEVILERFEEIQRLYPCHSFNRADQISLNKRYIVSSDSSYVIK